MDTRTQTARKRIEQMTYTELVVCFFWASPAVWAAAEVREAGAGAVAAFGAAALLAWASIELLKKTYEKEGTTWSV